MKKISVKVTPKASRNKIVPYMLPDEKGNDFYKIYITAPAEDGKANKAVIDALADYYDIAKSKISIISGLTSRTKIIEIDI